MTTPLPDDLEDAPPPVQEAARFVAQHGGGMRWLSAAGLASVLSGMVGTSYLHDVAGWGELASGAPLLVALVVVLGIVALGMRGPRRHLPAHRATLQRYRTLKGLGLTATPDPAEATTAVDRLCDRITALAGDRIAARDAALVARQRVASLQAERAHLAAMMAEDPALTETLAGVAERVASEVSRIRAHLAETYAALIEADTRGGVAEEALAETVARLVADGEVDQAAIRGTRATLQTQ
ncbi:MAG: hypothetical protein ACI8RZ_000518 [Myxococcota bacterium]|jgi:hypothetical protein